MSCAANCGGKCTGCLGAVTRAQFSYPGLRLRLPSTAPVRQGRLGVYRGPAEPPPNPNPGAGLGQVMPVSALRFPMQPSNGWRRPPIVGPLPVAYPISQAGPTQSTPQPPPNYWPSPAPVTPAPTCPGPNSYIDAAGNCTSDWHNPYSATLQAQQPASTIPAPTSVPCASGTYDANGNCLPASPASTVAATPSWFTDPNQELITGFPNWGLVAAAVGAFLLLRGKR
jgi:hypothetical protein